jgi:hypothetical protein
VVFSATYCHVHSFPPITSKTVIVSPRDGLPAKYSHLSELLEKAKLIRSTSGGLVPMVIHSDRYFISSQVYFGVL